MKAAADRSRPPALPDENPNTPLAPVVPAFTDRSTALPLLVAVTSPKPRDKAPTMPPSRASILLPAPLVLLPTVGDIDLPRPSMASPVPSHTAPMLPLDALPDENPNTPLAPVVPVVAVPSPKPKNKAPTVLTSLPPAMASILLPAPLVLLPTVGSSTSGAGSSIGAIAGGSTVNTVGVGALSLGFGEGTATSSGSAVLRSVNAGTTGASGVLVFSSGSASSGNISAVWLGTGEAMEGRGGLISFTSRLQASRREPRPR